MDRSKLTIVLVSYFSFNNLKRISKELKKYQILIIENSRDRLVQKYFYKKKILK